MKFEEFEKKFHYGDLHYYCMKVDGLCLQCYLDATDTGIIFISTYHENYDFHDGKIISHNEIIIGEYFKLKEAYEALKAICKLNGVEME